MSKQMKVLVTGASSGIGRATAVELAARGHTVLAAARREKELGELAVQHGIAPVPIDVTDAKSVLAAAGHVQELTGGYGVDVLVNSAGYALREPVNSIDQALGLLGFGTIRSIALSVSVVSLFQQEQAQFNMKAYWLHSAVVAGMCRSVAKLNRCCDPEHAFTFGLLKDIGKVILVENAPEETREIISTAQRRKLGFSAAAREVLETDDAEIAAWLCQTWIGMT